VDDTGLSTLELGAPLSAGRALIEIRYDAPFSDNLGSLYRVQHDGEHYAFTQFEALEARRAFPCFDEPAFKTPFEIWLTVPQGRVAVSNTPVVSTEQAPGGLQRLRYARTRPLPTYLVAFAVGPFDVVQGEPIAATALRPDPIPVRGIAVRGKGSQLRYALQHTAPLLLELERYFGIAYPYRKLDLIAVPDFGAGAMENAAAITFREWLLLLDPDQAPEHQRRAFAGVMAHELAHHWFGNLVTMPWWDDIWLNEAFATWLGHRVVERVHPEYRSNVALRASVLHVMDADSKASARRVRQPVETTHDVANAFDGITYQKGAGVLAMFEQYLGPEVFRRGVSDYLRSRAFGVGDSDDLFAALGAAAGRDVGPAIGSFVDQPGVPRVRAELRCEQGQATVALSQARYLPAGSEATRERLWRVPVCVRHGRRGKSAEHCTDLSTARGELQLPGPCPRWIMPNAGASGYYRWTLPEADLKRLRDHGLPRLSTVEMLSVVDSLTSAFDSGDMPGAEVLAAMTEVVDAEERAVAIAPMSLLYFVEERIADAQTRPALAGFARALYGNRMRELGYAPRADETGEARLMRADVATLLADVGDDGVVRTTLAELGRAYLGPPDGQLQPDNVTAELRGLAVRVALQEGDGALFDLALARLHRAEDSDARGALLQALSSVRDPARSARALQLVFDPKLHLNEVLVPIARQLGDRRTREAAWAFVERRYDEIVERVSGSGAGRLPHFAATFCTEEAGERVAKFFEGRAEKLRGGPRNLALALETIRLCDARVRAQRESVQRFLRNR
jgi:alanyl aminopeptidase